MQEPKRQQEKTGNKINATDLAIEHISKLLRKAYHKRPDLLWDFYRELEKRVLKYISL